MLKYLIIFTLMLTACAPVDADVRALLSTQPAYIAPAATVQPATASPEPTAAIDYAATLQVEREANLQKEQKIARLVQTQTAATAGAEQRALEYTQMTAQSDAFTATAALTALPLTATQAEHDRTRWNAVSTDVAAHNAATAGAPQANATGTQMALLAQSAPIRAQIDMYFPPALLLVLLALAAGMFVVSGRVAQYAQAINNQPEPETPITINHVTTNNGGFTSTRRIPDPPGDVANVREWAIAALDGQSVAVARWEREGSPLGGYREYRHGVYAWLVKWELVELKKELVLNELGRSIVGDWLAAHPLPTDQITPKEAPTSSTPVASMPVDGVGEGYQFAITPVKGKKKG